MLDSTVRKIQRDRESAVKRAEREDGFREGTFRHKMNGAICHVEVTFYPTRKWWVEALDKNGNASGRRLLTRQLWTRLEPAIKLKD
jgi:hypothetical protein